MSMSRIRPNVSLDAAVGRFVVGMRMTFLVAKGSRVTFMGATTISGCEMS